MAHNISALIAKAPIDLEAARQLDLPVFVQNGFVIVALYDRHVDFWTQKLGMESRALSEIILDFPVVHEFARRLGMDRYALIETDYFGGMGSQRAAAYCVADPQMEAEIGSINAALARIGVERAAGKDEFDTIGLADHRSFSDLFKKYWDL